MEVGTPRPDRPVQSAVALAKVEADRQYSQSVAIGPERASHLKEAAYVSKLGSLVGPSGMPAWGYIIDDG